MTPEEATKRLEDILNVIQAAANNLEGLPDLHKSKAKQALSQLFRDVIGEVIRLNLTGEDIVEYAKLCMGDYPGDKTLQFVETKQRTTAARYFPVDGGGEK